MALRWTDSEIDFPKILLIENCPNASSFVSQSLAECKIETCATLEAASTKLERASYDLIISEIALPETDIVRHFQWIRWAVSDRKQAVIVLTQEHDISKKLVTFEVGAVDFIGKPVHPLELRARVLSKIQFHKLKKTDLTEISFGSLKLYPSQQRCVIKKGQTDNIIKLTPTEFRLLHFLVQRNGEVITRSQIKSEVWGDDLHIHNRSIDKHVHTLKGKFPDSQLPIESVHGVGYRLPFPRVPS